MLINPGMSNISMNENFALVVIWDTTGTKVLKSSLVALESDGNSQLSYDKLFSIFSKWENVENKDSLFLT
jgi:hypothetical protein